MRNFLIALLLLTSCTVGDDYVGPKLDIKNDWATNNELIVAEEISQEWWKNFDDELLNELIADAAENNKDIKIAIANVGQAKALRGISDASFYPTIELGTSSQREGFSKSTSVNRVNTERERNNFDTSLDASWELDFFGANQRAFEVADANFKATQEDKRNVMLTILAEVARNYFEVRGLQKRIKISNENLQLLKEVEDIAQASFDAGIVTELDVSLAKGDRQELEATIPLLETDMMAGVYRLSVLTGKTPSFYSEKLQKASNLPSPADLVPVGLPSDMLKRRPDVRAAESLLAASSANIAVKKADSFPKFSLTGSVGTGALYFSDLFTTDAILYSIGAVMDWTIYSGGAETASIEAAKFENQAALAQYEKTILEAIEDAEKALLSYGKEWQSLKRYAEANKTRKNSFDIAKIRYEQGEGDFLSLIEAERALSDVQDEIIQSETRILLKLTDVYKSLGGGWEVFE